MKKTTPYYLGKCILPNLRSKLEEKTYLTAIKKQLKRYNLKNSKRKANFLKSRICSLPPKFRNIKYYHKF